MSFWDVGCEGEALVGDGDDIACVSGDNVGVFGYLGAG